jgi:hypothetical protein
MTILKWLQQEDRFGIQKLIDLVTITKQIINNTALDPTQSNKTQKKHFNAHHDSEIARLSVLKFTDTV